GGGLPSVPYSEWNLPRFCALFWASTTNHSSGPSVPGCSSPAVSGQQRNWRRGRRTRLPMPQLSIGGPRGCAPPARRCLRRAGLARRREWALGHLIELLATLGHAEGLAPVLTLLDSGLLIPVLTESISALRDWESWLGSAPTAARVIVPPVVAERAIREGTGL